MVLKLPSVGSRDLNRPEKPGKPETGAGPTIMAGFLSGLITLENDTTFVFHDRSG